MATGIVHPIELIHIVGGLPERNGRLVKTRCGVWIEETHGLRLEPTCPDCQRLEADDDAGLAALLAEGGL